MKPIQTAFKVAQAGLCLANEWRDTASYLVGTAITASQVWNGHPKALPIFLLAAVMREWGIRSYGWLLFPPATLAGDNFSQIDPRKNVGATFAVAGVIAVGVIVVLDSSLWLGYLPVAYIFGSGCKLLMRQGGKLRDIPALYFHKETGMWDWPRKEGGNGPTQTKKFMDGMKRAASTIGERAGRLVPYPAPIPIRTPARSRAVTLQR